MALYSLLFSSVVSAQVPLDHEPVFLASYNAQKQHIVGNVSAQQHFLRQSPEDAEIRLKGCRAAFRLYHSQMSDSQMSDAEIASIAGECLAILDFQMYPKLLSGQMKPKNLSDEEMKRALKAVDHQAVGEESLILAYRILAGEAESL